MVALYNNSKLDYVVENFQRIAQIVIAPYITADFEEVEDLNDSERGHGGFGSTGTK